MHAVTRICGIAILSGLGIASSSLADDGGVDQSTVQGEPRVLNDGRVVIGYKGGSYIGFVYTNPDTGEPVWQGRCAFYFKTGAVFEGTCADGRFLRGFLRSANERSVKFLDTERSNAEAVRSSRERIGL